MRVSKTGAVEGHEQVIVEGSDLDSVNLCETYILSISNPECELLLPENGVVIPKRSSGRLIGAHGSNKENLERKSGAVIEYDEENSKVVIKGTQKAVDAAAVLVRKFIADELLPKRRLGKEEQALAAEAERVGIHLNTNQLDTFSKCVKETYTLALRSFVAEDSQFSVLMKKQGIKWTWRHCDVDSAEYDEVPPALALELERLRVDGNDCCVLCLNDASSYEVSLHKMVVRNLADSRNFQLLRSCSGSTLLASRAVSNSISTDSASAETVSKAATLSHRLTQFGFQHREITICLRNGCSPENDPMIGALTDLVACTWLSSAAAQNAKKCGSTATSHMSGGLVPMFVKPQQDPHQKVQQQPSWVSTRRPVVLDGSNVALRHGAFYEYNAFLAIALILVFFGLFYNCACNIYLWRLRFQFAAWLFHRCQVLQNLSAVKVYWLLSIGFMAKATKFMSSYPKAVWMLILLCSIRLAWIITSCCRSAAQ
jgi:hypothetical protein